MSAARNWSARAPVVAGLVALALLVGGLGAWSAVARIAGAVIASGIIEVEGARQVVQHPDGGVVGEILVNDGDFVGAGDVLLRLDDTLLRSELAINEAQLWEHVARRNRLTAERDDAEEIVFDADLTAAAAADPAIADIVEGQRNLFFARKTTLDNQVAQLAERKSQIATQIEGKAAQLSALQTQLELIAEEKQDQQTLLDKGLAQASRVLALRREEARLQGQVGELTAGIAEDRGRIAEVEIESLRLTSQIREEAISRLRDLQYRETELRERRLALGETLARLEVRAPVSGVIYGKQVHAVRSVVRPADPLMYVVPQDQNLVITSRIESIHVDEIHVGQEAILRFPAFNQRQTPEIKGRVTRVSADAFRDENTGQSFYSAEVVPLDGEVQKLGALQLLPGMPVEAFIATGDRTPLNYLVKPLADYFNKAFRET